MRTVDTSKTVGRFVVELRQKYGYTQESLVAATARDGLPALGAGTISMTETDRRLPSTDVVDRIADAMKVTRAEREQLHELRNAQKKAALRMRPTPEKLESVLTVLTEALSRIDQLEGEVRSLKARLRSAKSTPR